MSYMVLDFETNIRAYLKRKASPFHPDNAPVICISKRSGEDTKVEFLPRFYDKAAPKEFPLGLDGVTVLVGHNLKFDLLHCWEFPELQQWLKDGGTIWDCQYAEYLLEGQQPHAQMCSMDSIAEKYGGELKPEMVKQYWEQGIDTVDIPIDLLKEYCEGDGDNPERIFRGQVARAAKLGKNFIEMVKLRMDGLLATTEMEYNGLKIDSEKAEAQRLSAQERLDAMDAELLQYIPTLPPELEFKWSSRYLRSYLFYGGVAKYLKWVHHTDPDTKEPLYAIRTEKWPMFDGQPVDPALCELDASGLHILSGDGANGEVSTQDDFKSGKRIGEGKTKVVSLPDYEKPKGAKQAHFFTFPGYTTPSKKWLSAGEDGKGGPLYSTNSDVVEALSNRGVPFLRLFADRQRLDKDLGTYYWKEDKEGNRKGMMTLISEYDGLIHHKLNHDITVTTRLSSSDPNMQNLPRKDKSTVKELFISRFQDGEMGEIDYSQLEVIVQGWLTEDANLRTDIIKGIDFHCKRLSQKLGEDYELVKRKAKDEEHEDFIVYSGMRTKVKGFSFQRAYGAGADAISEATGMPVDEVKQLIQDEMVLYPSIEKFNAGVAKAVDRSKQITDDVLFTPKGVVKRCMGQWAAPTGTIYTFFESEAPGFMQDRGIKASFSPPDMKNYPIQGTGGEIVQMVLGKLFRLHLQKDRYGGKALLVNTVHDCVWFDFEREVRDEVLNDAVRVMQGIPVFLNKHFNIDCGVLFRVDAEFGPDMYNLHHFDSPYYIKG